jgi:hypothetical protein
MGHILGFFLVQIKIAVRGNMRWETRPTFGPVKSSWKKFAVGSLFSIEESMGSPLFSYFPFSPFSYLGPILWRFGREKNKKKGKTFFKKYKEGDLETQIATHTNQYDMICSN